MNKDFRVKDCAHILCFDWRKSEAVFAKVLNPTKTYIENLTRKTSVAPIESVLVWGNPWAGVQQCGLSQDLSYVVYPIFTKHGRFGWGDFCQEADNGDDIPYSMRHQFTDMFGCNSEETIQNALRYRFDLRNAT